MQTPEKKLIFTLSGNQPEIDLGATHVFVHVGFDGLAGTVRSRAMFPTQELFKAGWGTTFSLTTLTIEDLYPTMRLTSEAGLSFVGRKHPHLPFSFTAARQVNATDAPYVSGEPMVYFDAVRFYADLLVVRQALDASDADYARYLDRRAGRLEAQYATHSSRKLSHRVLNPQDPVQQWQYEVTY